MNTIEQQYKGLVQEILYRGEKKLDRTGVGTYSIFAGRLAAPLYEGFPLLTTKKVFFRGIVEELFWFLRGETMVQSLQDRGVHIWDEWAGEDGGLGPIYGLQWRHWGGGYHYRPEVDQIKDALETLQTNPDSRRIIVSAWNPQDLPMMHLAPCHILFQFYVSNRKLSCQVYQRSADLFLGVPFNIASYALLTQMFARHVGLEPGTLYWVGGDCHLYTNHLDQAKAQIARESRGLPKLKWKAKETNPLILCHYPAEEVVAVENYNPHPALPAPVAV